MFTLKARIHKFQEEILQMNNQNDKIFKLLEVELISVMIAWRKYRLINISKYSSQSVNDLFKHN